MSNKVQDNTEINDVRTQPNFKGISFSNFKKTDVKKQLMENMKNNKVEPACYWCAELVCSGNFGELWEIYIHYIGKHIHLGNPKILLYMDKRFEIFRNIMTQTHFLSELELRNNPTLRNLFAEITSILTISNKKHSFEPIKINKEEEFDITQMNTRLIAPNISYIEPIFKPEDPKELFIATNEFAYNISNDKPNMLNACYWIEWVIEFQNICKKRKNNCHCETRLYNVDNKFKNDTIWILWDCLLHYATTQKSDFIKQLMQSAINIFCIKYTTAASKKRRFLLYFAVALLTENVQTNIDVITDKKIVQNVISKINSIYKQIKKNEHSPNTEYLFANLEKQNTFEQSMRKMELVNNMDFSSKI
jgi:hypothetical protein